LLTWGDSKWAKSFDAGGGKKLKNIGMSKTDMANVNMTLIDATIPNSTNKPDPVNAKTPKPMEVVKLAKNNVLPILDVLSIKDSILF
jgi:hypothetical protein